MPALGLGLSLSASGFVRIDPITGSFPFNLRLQTHNGDKIPRNMYKDVACTLPATLEGDVIAGWKDPNSGLIATQLTVGARPLLHFDLGFPTIIFDGVDDFLSLPNTGIATAAEMFIGVKNVVVAGFPMWDLGGITTDDRNCYIPFGDGNNYDSFFTTIRKQYPSGATNYAVWFVYNPLSQNNLWQAYVNNSLAFSVAGSNVFVTATTNTLGKASGGFRNMAVSSLLIGPPVSNRTFIYNYVNSLNPH